MKNRIPGILFLVILVAGITYGCKDHALFSEVETTIEDYSADAQMEGTYDVDLDVSQSAGISTWTYTITKENGKRPGHFILDFGNCGNESPTISNIVSVTVNGVDWSCRIRSSEGRTGCIVPSTNFVKFDDLPSADESVIEFTLDTLYSQVLTTGWIKAGRTCRTQTVPGPGCRGYILTAAMDADASMAGKKYNEINTYMKQFGFDYSEHPNCTGGYGGHIDGTHCDITQDVTLDKPVFQFDIHIDPVIDGDRCSSGTVDRQRNEMKSITNNTTWAKVQGNYDEWQILEWRFKLPADFQPTTSFCHIHQLKAQELLHNQVEGLEKNLTEYGYSGVGRDDGATRGEYSPVFYKKDKFKVLDKGTFWLSETPDQPGKGWDASLPRICSWVQLQERPSGKKIFLFNTHFDHRGQQARKESARLIVENVKKIAGKSPAILTGDFNFDQLHENYTLINSSDALQDCFDLSPIKMLHNGTSNNFNISSNSDRRIDHIFVTSAIEVKRYGILTDSYKGKFPSDHFPVMVVVVMK